MSYNGSGTYIPPAGQPVATGTVIQSATFNTLVTDIGNTFNNVLPRDGQASMAGQLKIIDGTNSVPGFAFNSEASTGIFRPIPGALALVTSGVEGLRVSTGRVLIGTTTDDGISKVQVGGPISVTGQTTFAAALNATGATNLNTLAVAGATTLSTTLGVTGTATFNGLVGIGVAPPDSSYKLRVISPARFGDSGTGSDYLDVASTNNVNLRLQAQGSNNVASVGTTSSNALTLFTNNVESLRVDATGKVLVGRTADDGTGARLQVSGNASVSGQLAIGSQQSTLVSVVTAPRTYTFPDKSGTVAMAADLAGVTGSHKRSVRSINTMLAAADNSTFVDLSGSFTQTFDTPANLANGWYCIIRNNGTGNITVPASDGRTNWIMYPGEVRMFLSDGTVLYSTVLVGYRFTTQTSGTWIRPPGYNSHKIKLTGGGGGGGGGAGGASGGSYNSAGNSGASGNGGAGGGCGITAEGFFADALFSTSISFTIGAGGAGGAGGVGGAGTASGVSGNGNSGASGSNGAAGVASNFAGNTSVISMSASGGVGGTGATAASSYSFAASQVSTNVNSAFSASSYGVYTLPVVSTSLGNVGTAGTTNATGPALGTAGGNGGSGIGSYWAYSSTAGGTPGAGNAVLGAAAPAGGAGYVATYPGFGGGGGGGGAGSAGCGQANPGATGNGGNGGAGGNGTAGQIEIVGVL